MAVHWQIKFKSLRADTLYTVSIYDDSFSGTPVQLVGAAEPFVTQEENDDDKFLPVRTQSGYIRIVDTGLDMDGDPFDWHDLIPSTQFERPVALYAGATLVWQGYIRPDTYDGPYPATAAQERDFPIVCCLSALSAFNLNIHPTEQSGDNITTFAGLLYQIFGRGLTANSNVYIQGTEAVTTWLYCKLDMLILKDRTLLDALTEVCKFWGWTCRTDGSDIYLEAADDTSQMADGAWTCIQVKSFDSIDQGRTETGTIYPFVSKTVAIADFATINNRETILQGILEAKVTADIGPENVLPSIPFDYIAQQFATIAGQQVASYGSESGQAVYKFRKERTFSSGKKTYTKDDQTIDAFTAVVGGLLYGGTFEVVDWYTGKLADKKNYDWQTRLWLLASSTYAPDPCLRMSTDYAMTFPRGAIVIAGTVYSEYVTVNGSNATYHTYTANGTLTCRLKVGDKYYRGTGVDPNPWTTTPTTFTIQIGNGESSETEGKGSIVTNRTYTTDYKPYTGHGCAILNDGELSGVVTFEIVRFDLDNGHGYTPFQMYIEDLKLSFVRRATDAAQGEDKQNEYTQNGGYFSEKVEEKVIFASYKNNPPGRGLITLSNNYVQSVPYEYEVLHERPEQHMANRIGNWGSVKRRVFELELQTNRIPITPRTKVTTPDSVVTYPIAIDHYWRDDVTRIKTIEL